MSRNTRYLKIYPLCLTAFMFAAWMSTTGTAQAQQQPTPLYDLLLELKHPTASPMPYHSSDGILQWNFVIKNNSPVDIIPAGVRFRINLDIPGRLKMIYFDTRPGLPTTVQTPKYWQCDAPYDETSSKPYAPAPYHEWGGVNHKHTAPIPHRFNCYFETDVAVPAGQEIRHLFVYTDGGYPSSTPVCARSSSWTKIGGQWLRNTDPVKLGSNVKCFNKPAGTNPSVDFNDLELHSGMSGVGTIWQAWSPKIANIGTNPIPIMKSVITQYKPLSGFEYKSYIPPGASLTELRVTRGWECRIRSNQPKQVGPFPASGRIQLSGPEQTFDPTASGLGTNGSTLLCTYATEYEFGSQAKLAADKYSEPVYYVTKNWPMTSHPTKCSDVRSIHGSGPNALSEPTTKLANNRSCVNVSTGQPTQCPATCPPLW